MVTDVSQDGPFTIIRWTADAILTEFIVPGVDVVLRVTQNFTSSAAAAFYQ
ncbi:MAG: hypothetical protein J4O03_10805 [Chloroflexi bacterium]|nr:hypothetical protein [Chloroflexota bacterium]